MSPLAAAVTPGSNIDNARLLLESGALVDARFFDLRMTALHVAVSRNYLKGAELLLGRGADVNARYCQNLPLDADVTPTMLASGYTALHIAAMYRHSAMINLLLARGAAIDAADARGVTPLLSAIEMAPYTLHVLFWPMYEGLQRGLDCDFDATIIMTLLQAGANLNAMRTDANMSANQYIQQARAGARLFEVRQQLLADNSVSTARCRMGCQIM